MTIHDANFTFNSGKYGVCRVHFSYPVDGLAVVIVWVGNKRTKYDNHGKNIYRPCVTHCLELIRRSIDAKPANEFDCHRRKSVRKFGEPIALKVAGDEE